MNINLRKRTIGSLRKLTKVSSENEVLGDPIYVRLEEADGNVTDVGTPINDEVLNNINWKDNTSVEMVPKDGTTLPDRKENVTQIVSLSNGEIWCVPGVSTVEPFLLGNVDLGEYLKKNHQDYENLILLGSNTKVGALPADYNETGDSNPSTYLDISDGAVNFKINGVTKCSLNTGGVSSNNGNTQLIINNDEIALKNHSASTTIGLMNNSFYIKGNNTQISEDLANNKLNFFTNLANAVYGNATIYLEFYSDQVRFKSSSGSNLLTIKTDGTIYAGSSPYTYIVNSNNVNSYIETYFNNSFEIHFDTQFNSKYASAFDTQFNLQHASAFDTQFNAKFYDKFNYYLEQDFETRFRQCYVGVASYTTLFMGCNSLLPYLLTDDEHLYKIDFSDTPDGYIHTIIIKGTEIGSTQTYIPLNGCSYEVIQSYSDGDSDDTIRVAKYDSSGSFVGNVYIRGIYKY